MNTESCIWQLRFFIWMNNTVNCEGPEKVFKTININELTCGISPKTNWDNGTIQLKEYTGKMGKSLKTMTKRPHHWFLKRMSFPYFFRMISPVTSLENSFPRWYSLIFEYVLEINFTKSKIWFSETDVSNMWSSRPTNTTDKFVSVRTDVATESCSPSPENVCFT